MTVIVNTFEVLVEPPTSSAASQPAETPPPAAPALRPEDIERIVRHFETRAARLQAD